MKKSMKIISILLIVLLGGLAIFFAVSGIQNFNLTKTALKIKIDDATKTYDGTPLTGSSYQITEGNLNNGDSIKIDYENSLTDVGSSSTNGQVTIVDKNGNDVTKNYDIETTQGNLEVTKSSLDINVNSETLTYGEEFNDESYSLSDSSSLGNGDSIITSFSTTDDGDEKVTFTVVNKNGEDVSTNYKINVTGGSQETSSTDSTIISIEQRNIYIKPLTVTKVYDGTKLNIVDNSFTYFNNSETLVSGDKITFTYDYGTLISKVDGKNCFNGTYSIKKDSIKITSKSGEDVTQYYNINLDSAQIGIYEQEISLKFKTFTYDEININSENDIFSNLDSYSTLDLTIDPNELNNLKTYLTSLDAGTYKYEYDYDNPLFYGVDNNYLVTFNDIYIAKQVINVSFKDSLEKVYEGGKISITSSDLVFKDSSNNEFELDSKSLEVFNLSYNLYEDSNNNQKVSLYSLSLRKKVGNAYKDVTNNYNINYLDGSITITKADLVIKPVDASKEYDGKALYFSSYEIVNGQLYNNDYLIIDYSDQGSITNVSDSKSLEFDCSKIKVMSSTGEDVTKYYNITSEEGNLKITKTNYELQFKDVTYGQGFNSSSTKDIFTNAPSGLTISSSDYNNFNNYVKTLSVGSHEIDLTKYSFINQDSSSNYNYVVSSLTVLKGNQTLKLTVSDKTGLTYDGTYPGNYNSSNFDLVKKGIINVTGLNENDHIVVTYSWSNSSEKTEINKGIFKYSIDSIKVFDSNGNDVTEDYNIDNYTNTFTISDFNLLNLDVSITSMSVTYDEDIDYTDTYFLKNMVSVSSLLNGNYIDWTSSSINYDDSNSNIWTISVTSLSISDNEGNDVSIFYDDSSYLQVKGYLSINPKTIYVTLNDIYLTYDESLSIDETSLYKKNNNGDPKCIITYYNGTNVTTLDYISQHAGTYTFTYELDDSVKDNYNLVIYGNGIISIAKKEIEVTLNSQYLTYGEDLDASTLVTKNYSNGPTGTITYYKNGVETSSISNVGTYTFTYSLDDEDKDNYNLTINGSGTITVSKKQIIVTLLDSSIDVNESISSKDIVKLSYNGYFDSSLGSVEIYYNNELYNTIEYGSSITLTKAGTYTFIYTINDSNYELVTNGSGKLDVNKIKISATLNAQYLTYGDSINTSLLVTKGNLSNPDGEIKYYKNGEEITINDIKNVGTYTFTYVLDSSYSSEYELSLSGNGIIVISKKSVNVSLNNVNKTLNDTLSENELIIVLSSDLTYNDFTFICYQNGTQVSIDDITSTAGTYTYSFVCNDGNYEINYINSTGTIVVA